MHPLQAPRKRDQLEENNPRSNKGLGVRKAISVGCYLPRHFAPSHRGHATRSAGCVGEQAEGKKAEQYAHLAPTYLFQPVAIETSGAISSRSRAFLRELGRRVGAQTGEARSTTYFFQRLSVAIQRGNAAAVMGCVPRPG